MSIGELWRRKKNNPFYFKAVCIAVGFLLCVSPYIRAQSDTYSWANVPIGGGGFVSGIITQKTASGPVVYARTDVGGAYRWDPAQNTWLPLLDWAAENQSGFLGTESLAIDPQNPNRVYILAGISYFNNGNSAILKSSDYGKTFTVVDVSAQFKAHGNGMGRQNGERLQVDPLNSNILYCGTRWNGLFKSTDQGSTWSRVNALNVTTTPNENGLCFVVLDKSKSLNGSTQRIFVGVSRSGSANIYKSEDGGASFTAVTNASLPSTFMPQRAVLDGAGNLYVTYGDGAGPHGHWAVPEPFTNGGVWKYNIAGNTWTNVTPNDPDDATKKFAKPFGGISVDPNNSQRIICSTTNTYYLQEDAYGDRFFLSTDGGATWTDLVKRGFDLDPNGITWVAGHSIHWAGSIEFDPNDSKKVWVTSGNGVFVNSDIDATLGVWKFTVKGLEEVVPVGLVSIPSGPVVSVILDYDGFRHTDIKNYSPIHTPRIGSTTGLSFANANTNKLLRVGVKIQYSLDQGVSWTECPTIKKEKGQVCISQNGTTEIFMHSPADTTVSFRSVDRGANWSAISGLSINNARIVADGSNSNTFYAYNPSNGGLYRSAGNNGSSFSQIATIATNGSQLIRAIPGREGHLWMAMFSGGLIRSTNGGSNFSTISNVTYCGAVGYGKEVSAGAYPTIYIWGTVNGVLGVYRSTNEGASWIRVNDDQHEYGGPANGQFVMGDANVYGRVYMSTAGRGIVYGEISGFNVSPASLTVGASASGSTVTVSASSSWTVSESLTWITVSATSGSGNGTFTINTTANSGSSSRTGTVTVTSGGVSKTISVTQSGCTPTTITPYLQINGGSWQSVSTASVSAGSSVKFGPQPATGGTWSWSGPNGFTATTREITISSIQTSQAGNYVATYTNASGCVSTHTSTISVTGGSRSIGVRARGTASGAVINLRVNGTTISSWTLTTTLATYSTTTTATGTVSVHFVNDGGSLDVQVDYVTIAGVTYQAENQPVNTGRYINGACGGSYSEMLQCNGYINFTNSGSARIATGDLESTDEFDAENSERITAFPNPVTDHVRVILPNNRSEKVLHLLDASGKVLRSDKTQASEHVIDMTNAHAGLYVIRVIDNVGRSTIKIYKK